MLKQVIILRKDLNMRKGKMVAQGAHGAVMCALLSESDILNAWLKDGQKKITVGCRSLEELSKLDVKAKEANLQAFLVTDNGLTEFHGEKTITALVIGPCKEEEVDPITQHLTLL